MAACRWWVLTCVCVYVWLAGSPSAPLWPSWRDPCWSLCCAAPQPPAPLTTRTPTPPSPSSWRSSSRWPVISRSVGIGTSCHSQNLVFGWLFAVCSPTILIWIVFARMYHSSDEVLLSNYHATVCMSCPITGEVRLWGAAVAGAGHAGRAWCCPHAGAPQCLCLLPAHLHDDGRSRGAAWAHPPRQTGRAWGSSFSSL